MQIDLPIEMEENPRSGFQSVKLHQTIPEPLEIIFQKKVWLENLLTAHFTSQKGDQFERIEIAEKLPGGFSGCPMLATLVFRSGAQKKVVLKNGGPDEKRTRELYTYRESVFYGDFLPTFYKRLKEEPNLKKIEFTNQQDEKKSRVQSLFRDLFPPNDICIPKVIVSVVDPVNGRNLSILEFLEDCHSLTPPLIIDGHSTVEFNKQLGISETESSELLYEECVKKAAVQIANLHGAFWRDTEALEKGREHLKCAGWFFGENQKDFDRQMRDCTGHITDIQTEITPEMKQQYPKCCRVMEVQMDKISFDEVCHRLQSPSYEWTMVHGDYHPGQTMFSSSTREVTFFDFEYVGFYNPAVDLFNFTIHMPPESRRIFQPVFLKTYHERLMQFKRVPKTYTYDRMMEDLYTHGLARITSWFAVSRWVGDIEIWVWMAERVEAFLTDHSIDIEKMQQPGYGFY